MIREVTLQEEVTSRWFRGGFELVEALVDSPGLFCMLLSISVVSWGGRGKPYICLV